MKKQNSKAKKTTTKKIKKIAIDQPLRKMNRGQLDGVAKQLKLKPSSYANIKELVEALTPLTKQPKAAKRAARKKGRKFDWNKAFEFYIADHTRSYADVAKQFGVVKKTIEQAAKYEYTDGKRKGTWCSWAERRQELGDIARKKTEEDYKKTAPARSEQHLMQYRNLQIATSQKITALAATGKTLVDPTTGQKFKIQDFDARQLADVAKALKLAIDGERVIMGLATSVATIKPGSDDETGKGWGELLALAMKEASKDAETND